MKKFKTDVVVMGSGLSGICAADAVLEQGKKVMVFEKKPYQGGAVGNCPIAYICIPNSEEYQDKVFKLIYDYTNYNADPAVIRQYVKNSWRTKDYLERMHIKKMCVQSVPIDEVGDPKYANGFPAAVIAYGEFYMAQGQGKGHAGALLCLRGKQNIEKRGGIYMLDTPIKDVIQDENGKIIGVIAEENQTGERVEVECEALIICSGGIMADRELMKEKTGFTYTDYNCSDGGNVLFNCFPNSGQTGDGQKLAWKLGGEETAIAVTGHNLVPGPGIVASSPWIVYNEMRTLQEQPYLWVNRNGERFVDESISNNHMAISTAIKNQPGRVSYFVIDEDTRQRLENEGLDYMYFMFPIDKFHDIPGQIRHLRDDLGNKHVFMEDTIEDLCKAAGIDEKGMKATLRRYNDFCDKKHDDDFAKNPAYLYPVRKGPFYALRVFCAGYNTIGGIRVNGKMQVINTEGKPIPGLYAAGDAVQTALYGNPPTGASAGAYFAMPLGFAAGDSVCEYIDEHTKNGRDEEVLFA